MLVLTRKIGEGIAIGDDIKIVVMQIKGKQVRLGIKANSKTAVHREEIFQKIQEENERASTAAPDSLMSAAANLLNSGACLSLRNGPRLLSSISLESSTPRFF